MLGPMTLYHLDTAPPRLESPIVVAAFDGWVDGGRAGTHVTLALMMS